MDSDHNKFDNYIKNLLKQSKSLSASDFQPEYPPMYNVFLEDIEDTPRDFLIFVFSTIFHKSKVSALAAAKKLEKEGRIECSLYSRDVAETKIIEVTEYSFENGYPLKCTMQKGRQNVIEKS
jgi:ATP-dependent Clp protease adaptor protein ClpS